MKSEKQEAREIILDAGMELSDEEVEQVTGGFCGTTIDDSIFKEALI